jgi:ATP-dependent exoDNAse (exonuclease V) alpha subunit
MTTLRPLEDGQLSKLKDRDACAPEMIQQWREAWADIQNRTFERLQVKDSDGRILRVDHRSYDAQGIDREPTQHMGVLATAMERDGKPTEIGERNRAILMANDNRQLFRRQAGTMTRDEIALTARDGLQELRQVPARDRDDHTLGL